MNTYRTVVLGATTNPARYAYRAMQMLLYNGVEAIPVGIRKGETAGGMTILNDCPLLQDVHTITLYLNPQVQKDYYDYIVSLKPKRVIFNPGTENPELYGIIRSQLPGTYIEVACTLVMLSVGSYKEAVGEE